jgi:anti-sigma B factor antagonist
VRLADLSADRRDGVVVARLEGEVDMSNAEELRNALVRNMTNEVFGLVLDLSEVKYFDSAGIHILFELREQLKNRGQQLRLVVPKGSPVGDTLRISGVGAVVVLDEELDSAIDGIDRPGEART